MKLKQERHWRKDKIKEKYDRSNNTNKTQTSAHPNKTDKTKARKTKQLGRTAVWRNYIKSKNKKSERIKPGGILKHLRSSKKGQNNDNKSEKSKRRKQQLKQ